MAIRWNRRIISFDNEMSKILKRKQQTESFQLYWFSAFDRE